MEVDSEIRSIDTLEDQISPLSPDLVEIRELISTLEMCHHKAGRWVDNIIEAIGTGTTNKGLSTRPSGSRHPTEELWQNVWSVLSAWCSGCPSGEVDTLLDGMPASQLLTSLGERSPLKEWQVQRVIDKIRSVSVEAGLPGSPQVRYQWLLLSGGAYESAYLEACPASFKEHEDFWEKTVRTLIRESDDNDHASLSLALAIDMLWPCHWRFLENLRIVLEAIGGNLRQTTPFAACGRNIQLYPKTNRMERTTRTLKVFCSKNVPDQEVDIKLLARLGKPSPAKRWLAASLAKTVTLQLNPPPQVRMMSDLAGTDWIRQG